MKKRSSIGLSIFFAALIVMLGCGGGSQNPTSNTNATANSNKSVGNNDSGETTARMTDKCTETNVTEGIKAGFKGNDSLENEYEGGSFTFRVDPKSDQYGDYFVVFVTGRIGLGDDNQDQMLFLQKSLRKYIKRDCVRRVYFVSEEEFKSPKKTTDQAANTTTGQSTELLREPFSWGTCEDGKDPCDDGSCSRPCARKGRGESDATAVANANASNKNSNTTVNTNANKP